MSGYPYGGGVIHAPGSDCEFERGGTADRQGVINGLTYHQEALCVTCFSAEELAELYRAAADQLDAIGIDKR